MTSLTICLIICVLTMISYVWGKLPMGLTALTSMAAFILTGCLDPKTALGYFGNSNGVMIVAMFVVAAGFTRTQFVKKAAASVNKIAHGSLTMVMLGYVLVTALLAQFIQSSVIVFGIMAPMMIATCDELKISPSKTLFPLSIVSISTISALPLGSGATQAAELNGYLEANAYTDFVVAITDPMKARLPMLIAVMIYCIFFATKFAPDAPVVQTSEMKTRRDDKAALPAFQERAGYIIFILTTLAPDFPASDQSRHLGYLSHRRRGYGPVWRPDGKRGHRLHQLVHGVPDRWFLCYGWGSHRDRRGRSGRRRSGRLRQQHQQPLHHRLYLLHRAFPAYPGDDEPHGYDYLHPHRHPGL